jgi:hypothetical protein
MPRAQVSSAYARRALVRRAVAPSATRRDALSIYNCSFLKLFLRAEMRVECSVCQAGSLHHFAYSYVLESPFTEKDSFRSSIKGEITMNRLTKKVATIVAATFSLRAASPRPQAKFHTHHPSRPTRAKPSPSSSWASRFPKRWPGALSWSRTGSKTYASYQFSGQVPVKYLPELGTCM